jgi:Tfp pilus assembly protein PilF
MNRRLLARLAFVCLALLFAPAAARAQGQNAIEGRVLLPSGAQPAQPVRVTLTLSGRRIHDVYTDLSGRFNFPGLRGGTYQLTAEGDGQTFETTSVSIDIGSILGGGQSLTQNIQLKARAGAPTPPAATIAAEAFDPDVPEHARAQYRKGLKSAADNKTEDAVKLFQEAVKAHERFYAANLALAEQLSKLQRYDEALAAYQKAGELKPDHADPYVGIGVTLISQKRYEEGIKMLRGVIEVDKNIASPYLSLGYAEMMTGDYAAAEEHLLRSLDLLKPALAHVYLANVYEQKGELEKALAQLEAYLKENPNSSQAQAVRGAIEKLRKRTKKP